MDEGASYSEGALLVSCSSRKNTEIIHEIIGSLPEPVEITENLKGYPWHIETKYYSADIKLYSLQSKDLVNAAFAEVVQAVVIHFNNKEVTSFEDVKCWMPFIKNFNPQVQLLVCDNCSDESGDNGLTRREIIDWCLKNQFELVELYPDEDSSDEDNDFKETRGYKRIIQALHAHPWPNLIMKDVPSYKPPQHLLDSLRSRESTASAENFDKLSADFDSLVKVTGAESVSSVEKEASPAQSDVSNDRASAEKVDLLLQEDKWIFDALNDDPELSSFEAMFEKFRDLKEKAASLEGNERRLYAEKVAIAFWRAMGCDEEEIAGLSSDENEN